MPSGKSITHHVPVAGLLLAALGIFPLSGCGSSSATNLVGGTTSKCQVTASASARSFPSAGGSGSVTVATDRECSWAASTDSSWVSLGSPASGLGAATLAFAVATNPAAAARSAGIRINDQQLQISEDAAPCRFEIDPTSGSFGSQGGNGRVSVSTVTGCTWSSSAGAPWLTIQTGSGTGDGLVSFTVAANAGAERAASLTIAGLAYAVTQAAAPTPTPVPPPPTPNPPPPPCGYTVSPTTKSVPAIGGSFTVAVNAGEGCNWTAASPADWLIVTAGASGTANGSVSVTAAPNGTATSRAASLIIAGQTVAVTQDGLPVVQLNGVVSQVSGNCPSVTFTIAGTTIVTDGETAFAGGTCADVVNDARVKVTGIQSANGSVAAAAVQIQK
jgi:hypothetical protein